MKTPKPSPEVTAAARALGAKGGSAKSAAKSAAAKANGAKGGRPKKSVENDTLKLRPFSPKIES